MRYRIRHTRGFTLIELMIVVAIVGVLATLAIYGVRGYVAHAKTTEARNSLGEISKDASTAFERETIGSSVLAAKVSTGVTRALCASASQTVPAAAASIKGTKYQANQAVLKDWNVDATANKGFACLKFGMAAPQYYLYNYTSDGNAAANPAVVGTQFTATANGDLNGNGILSTFTVLGAVAGANLYISPSIQEQSPDE